MFSINELVNHFQNLKSENDLIIHLLKTIAHVLLIMKRGILWANLSKQRDKIKYSSGMVFCSF